MVKVSMQVADPSGESDVLHYLLKFSVRRGHVAKAEIVGQGCVEQNGTRGGVAHVFPETLDFNFPHVVPGNGNPTRVHIVQAPQEFCQGALASSVFSHYGHVLTCPNVQVRNRQQSSISRISKRNVHKLDRPWMLLRKLDRSWAVRDRRLQRQDSLHLSDARERLLRPHVSLCGSAKWVEQLCHIGVERNKSSDRHRASEHTPAAVPNDRGHRHADRQACVERE